MTRPSTLAFFFGLLQACLLGAVHAGGPVYVNPAAAAAAAAVPAVDAAQLVTQTVYGFLDFTTTIGNTVMVFSPQSAPAAPEPSVAAPAPAPVITTQPPASVASAAPEIKPSKASAAKTSEKKTASSAAATPPPPPPPPTPSKKPVAPAEPKPAAPATPPSAAPATPPSAPAAPPAPPAAPAAPAVSSVVEVRGGPVVPAPSSKVEVRGPASVIASKVEVLQGWSTKVEVRSGASTPPSLSSIVEVRVGGDENNVDDPEYDFLSRQPAQVVDETYKVINLKPSSKFHKNRASVAPGAGNPRPRPSPTPAGQGPRILKTAAPQLGAKGRPAPPLDPTPAGSLHEETVALPLEQLFASQPALNRASRRPAPVPAFSSRFHRNRAADEDYDQTQRGGKAPPAPLQPSRSAAARPSQHTLRPSARKGGFSKHFGRGGASPPELATVSVYSSEPSSSSRRYQSASSARRSGFRPAVVTADAQRPAPSAPAAAADATPTSRRYKSRTLQPSAVGDPAAAAAASTSLYKFKLSRPAGRWSYKTTPKPRVAIRRQDEDGPAAPSPSPASVASPPQPQAAPAPDDAENEPASHLEPEQVPSDQASVPASQDLEEKPVPTAETIKVEISTPADFSDVYFELATIKSPYTFQVGTVKNTRYITVTSTFQKTLSVEPTSASGVVAPTAAAGVPGAAGDEPLTENLLASTLSPHYERREPLDSSIATLPPIALAGDASTPPLETLTETFSTTQLLLKTHILPVIYEGNTTRYTLVQSYHVTRLVTALKTLPPMDVYHFVPSKTLTDLNTRLEEAGSELHLELDFGEEDGKEEGEERPAAALRALAPDLDLSRVGSDFDLADVDRSRLPELQQHLRLKKAQKPEGAPQNQLTQPQPAQPALSPEQLQQLALLRFLNPAAAAALPQVITTSRPVVKLETVYESHVIPVFNGQSTSYSTISRPVATVSKTEYEVGTSTLPLPPLAPVLPQNPLFPNQQPQFAVTSSPLVTQTVVTATDSKVLKLTFGAKTAYTTLYSTRLVPTVLTTYLTASVPVQPTAPAFPGYFPPAYPQFPFVG